ncbi:hypothetical protein [Clavibacter michiganensis]|uniref:hypothetical protein n=1 Tax=Clavibacter michiganensis TaxID=28447 RepID=UPI0009A59851|nr:hypothetical protein [Clavibacter michiganensis]MBE3079669.1 hypothetical protein [Clavibacter michiganensis subsp. michiganensis]MBF4636481.1 hypothetical protein [Clavibacter michiganensis subsp. michiganensis]MDO4028912.1 hypothetical protein [Clavibacter michiganensis]MDO4123806.1 hypothetical protein [Clavibacter michiganensis]MDO4138830.1 hypothetical protein [Clavibacter michiganensis]
MTTRHRIIFATTLVITVGLLIAGVILLATSDFEDIRGRALCVAATGIGVAYVPMRRVQRRRPRR